MSQVLIAQRWPTLAGEVRAALLGEGRPDLAEQVDSLQIVAMCNCGDDFCQTIYCVPRPNGAWPDEKYTLDPDPPWEGYLIIDVVNGRVAELEILFREPLN